MISLGPWALDVDIAGGVRTSAFLDAPPGTYSESLGDIGFGNPRDPFVKMLRQVYPDGLEGRSVLDVACNCGGYLFWAKEAGAGRCFGFDIREHWISQARFLAEHRSEPTDDMHFEVRDLYELEGAGLEPFDIVLFNGIFYHLPEPVGGLRVAAGLAKELVVVNTATRAQLPDGVLAVSEESRSDVMSGVYGLNWFPSGPGVLSRICRWLGFPETRCHRWRTMPGQQPGLDRIELLAGRDGEFFRSYDAARSGPMRIRMLMNTRVPPRSTVLVADGGDEALLELSSREARRFPHDGGDADAGFPDAAAAIAELEEQRERGADYLVLPKRALSLLDRHPDFRRHLEDRYPAVVIDDSGTIFSLGAVHSLLA